MKTTIKMAVDEVVFETGKSYATITLDPEYPADDPLYLQVPNDFALRLAQLGAGEDDVSAALTLSVADPADLTEAQGEFVKVEDVATWLESIDRQIGRPGMDVNPRKLAELLRNGSWRKP